MLIAEEGKKGWVVMVEREIRVKDLVRCQDMGFFIRPDMDSPAVTGTVLDGTEWGDKLVW